MSPIPRSTLEKRFWNRFARRYDRFMQHSLQPAYDELLVQLQQDLQAQDDLLEAGTGTGLLAFALCRQVRHITATDIAEEMIRVSQEKQASSSCSNITFLVADSYQLPFPDEQFDVVLIANVLHLLVEPKTALREAKRVLRPDGLLIAPTFCHGEGLKSRIISHLMGLVGFKARHRWSLEAFQDFFKRQELKIDRFAIIKAAIPMGYVVGRNLQYGSGQ